MTAAGFFTIYKRKSMLTMEKTHSKINRICALAVFFIVLAVYFFVSSPSLSFWDCGEYVSAGVSLGVPHPPGNPFFMLLARVFTVLALPFQDVARRIVMIDVICGAFTAMLIYLTIVRVFVGFSGIPDSTRKRISIYLGGIIGALFFAFSTTVLFSIVETEVNGPQLLPIMLCTWLAMVWQQSKDANRDRFLVLIMYISFLGIGIHMYSMLSLAPVFLFVILNDRSKLTDYRFWMTTMISGLVMYSISWFIFLGAGLAILTLLFGLIKGSNQLKWRFCFFMVFFALLGFSTHAYIPIRSALQPMIDENHPVITVNNKGIDWSPFNDYLERKQYGSESMIGRMFHRRGSWGHQFGIEGHMGFGGFLLTQFFRFSPLDTQRNFIADDAATGFFKLLIYLLPLGLMFFGWQYLLKRHWRTGVFLIASVIMTTIVLVLYMNFADGSRAEKSDYQSWIQSGKQGPMPTVQREVRVRDYFWIGGFMFYALWIGIGAGAMLLLLFSSSNKTLRQTVAPICVLLWAVSPALPFYQNIGLHNRRFDFLPWDYAYNLLMSCEKGGILFTNGDNDTFPLWALQEGYGVRKDVRLVNLSLANTDWYIKQLRDLEPKVPISFSDRQIANLQPVLNPYGQATRITLDNAGLSVVVPGRDQHRAMLVQDKLVLNIINSTRWRKPIYFSTTVSSEHFMGADPYLQMQGLVYRLMPQEVSADQRFDLDRSLFMINKVYRFRGLGQRTATIEENAQALVSNYAACFMQTAFTLRTTLDELTAEIEQLKAKTTDSPDAALAQSLARKEAEQARLREITFSTMYQCIALMPWDWRPRMLLQEALVGAGKLDEAHKELETALKIDPTNQNFLRMDTQLENLKQKQGKSGTDSATPGSEPVR
jgi:hypothetical protein